MDPEQTKRVNEAAEKFAAAVRESLESASGHSADAQERSRQLTQSFFDSVSKELQKQTEGNQDVSRQLLEQSKKQQDALRELTQESMNAYQEFLGSVFSYYQAVADRSRGGSGS